MPNRCLTMVARCLTIVMRCLTKLIRCLTMVMRCLTKPIRCLTMVTRCLTKHYFISKNTLHKNKTPFLSPSQHILAFKSQNSHFAPSRLLSHFLKTTYFKYTKYITHSHSSPLFRGEGMGVRSLYCKHFLSSLKVPFLLIMPKSR